jgi:hypothetical protein
MLDSALGWIGTIAEWVGRWVPRWVILDTTEAAIKYVKGRPVLCPGGQIHWYWPATTTWHEYPTARQTVRLETQTMESTDGKTFIVSGIITFEVKDLFALMTTTYSPDGTVQELAASAVHDICCEFTWEELQAEQRKATLKTKLRNEAQKQLRGYGVEVLKLQLTSLARARAYKVSQSTSSEEL